MDTAMNNGTRTRRFCSIIPPDFNQLSAVQKANTSNSSIHRSSSNSQMAGYAENLDRASSLKRSCQEYQMKNCDNLSENRIGLKKSDACITSPFRDDRLKRTDAMRPTRKTQRSMSAHSVATPGPDSAILRDPLTGKIYKRGKLLGKGGFAKVYEGIELSTGRKCALKIIDKTKISLPLQREKVDAEIDLHAAASESGHPNIAKFEGTFENSRMICLVLELCSRRSLAQHLRRKEFLSESEVSDIVWQIICGLGHIHGCGLLHRDLKLGNILLSDDVTVKIADFGLATRTAWGKRRTICGTPNFIAPEVLNRQGHGPEADLWAVGCILYSLIVGKPPFDSASLKDTYKCILKNIYHIPSTVSQEATDLIRRLLQSNPQSRPTLNDVLSHAFFVKNETSKRFSGIEELARDYPHREIVSAPVIPLRRRSALPRMKISEESTGESYSNECCRLRHGNCISDPCLVTSAQYNENSNIQSTSRNSEANQEIKTTAENTVVNTTGKSEQENKSEIQLGENNNVYKNHHQLDSTPKREKMSPMKLLASKLQKIKIPSPKRCLKHATQKTKVATERVEVPQIVKIDSDETTWITKWVDYSNKYGFGYQLATGDIGVLFNDGSHIMLLRDGSTVEFVNGDCKSAEEAQVFPISSPPSGSLRTVNILRLFINYMDQNLKAHQGGSASQSPLQSTVRMLTWSRTTNHVVMYLSNGTLQVNFSDDHAKINVSNIHKKSSIKVSYVNKNKETAVYEGSQLLNMRNEEVRRRLRQVHEEFHFLLGELECVSHPFCNIFQDTSNVDTSPEYIDTQIDMIAAR